MKTDIFWIDGLTKGRLGVAPRPRGGEWLDDELQAWQAAGVDCVISALMPDEEAELELTSERTACRKHGLQFESVAIPDRGVPPSPSALGRLLSLITESLAAGKSVVIHCRQGIGRAALVAASVLTAIGENPDRAYSRVERARGRPVPDTNEQRMWVREKAAEYMCAEPGTETETEEAKPASKAKDSLMSVAATAGRGERIQLVLRGVEKCPHRRTAV